MLVIASGDGVCHCPRPCWSGGRGGRANKVNAKGGPSRRNNPEGELPHMLLLSQSSRQEAQALLSRHYDYWASVAV